MIDIGRGVKLIRRSKWGARAPLSTSGLTPSFGSTCHWEGPKMGTFPHTSCFTKVQVIQDFHMDTRGWVDIAYTALACPHGYVFEGRWVGRRTAANGTNAGNGSAYALCYLGGVGDPFTPEGKVAMRAGLDWLDANGGAGPGRNGHRDWKNTACPGDEIYTWVHSGQPAGTLQDEGDDWMSALTDAEQRELLRLTRLIFDETASNEEDCRLRETLIKVRGINQQLMDRGTLMKAPDEPNTGTVYYVDNGLQSKVGMPIGGALHEFIKGGRALAGLDTGAQVVARDVLDAIPDAHSGMA